MPTVTLLRDLRLAARSLRRRPGFATVACLTLAIGVGATTAIFSVINGVLLRPLPYPAPDELVLVNVAPTASGDHPGSMSYPDLADLRDAPGVFRTLIGVNPSNQTLTGLGDPQMIEVTRVTEGVLETFGARPAVGRDIRREEFGVGGPTVAVIGYGLWQDQFGGTPDVLERSITLNGVSYTIVGVAPQDFAFPSGASIWIPRSIDLAECGRGCHTMQAVGRLAAGTSLEAARASVDQEGRNLEGSYPETNTNKRFLVRELREGIVGNVETGLWIMLGAVGLVLLIACANVAGLLLARASARDGEMAVRAALGATRGRLAAHVLMESVVLAAIGGGAGVLLAGGGIRLLRSLVDSSLPRADLIGIDGTVLAVALGAVLLVMLIFGSIPALTASRSSLSGGLAGVGRGGHTAHTAIRFRHALLVGEVALSASLLIGAGLLFRTFTQLYAVDLGFETRDVSRFSLVLPEASYDIDQATRFYETLESQIAALPGVEAVGTMFGQPLGRGQATGSALIESEPEPDPSDNREASVRSITPGLLATLRIPLRRGRLLEPADNRRDAEPVALVSEEFVRQWFPNGDALGKRVQVTVDFDFGSPYWRIVGIVGDIHYAGLTDAPTADLYMPHAQFGPLSTAVHVRTAPGAPDVVGPIRDLVRGLDPNVPIYRVETLTQVLRVATAPTRLYMVLVSLFAAIAATLAAVGLYGVMSYLVVQRTREIGIRVALGARRAGIVGLVVGQGMRPALLGLAAGIGIAFAGGRFVQSILFGVQAHDPLVFTSAVALMAGVALLAGLLPALRASAIDPAKVLHGE